MSAKALQVPIVDREYTHPGGLLKFARIRIGDVHGVRVRYQPKDGGDELWFEIELAEWQRVVDAMRDSGPVIREAEDIPRSIPRTWLDGCES